MSRGSISFRQADGLFLAGLVALIAVIWIVLLHAQPTAAHLDLVVSRVEFQTGCPRSSDNGPGRQRMMGELEVDALDVEGVRRVEIRSGLVELEAMEPADAAPLPVEAADGRLDLFSADPDLGPRLTLEGRALGILDQIWLEPCTSGDLELRGGALGAGGVSSLTLRVDPPAGDAETEAARADDGEGPAEKAVAGVPVDADSGDGDSTTEGSAEGEPAVGETGEVRETAAEDDAEDSDAWIEVLVSLDASSASTTLTAQYLALAEKGGPIDYLRLEVEPTSGGRVRALGHSGPLWLTATPSEREVNRFTIAESVRLERLAFRRPSVTGAAESSILEGTIRYLGPDRKAPVGLASGDYLELDGLTNVRADLEADLATGQLHLRAVGEFRRMRSGPAGYLARRHLNFLERIYYSESRLIAIGILLGLATIAGAVFNGISLVYERRGRK